MDFSVATIKCYDTTKVHHEKRWLRQQRMLVIGTNEVLNCPFPAKNTPAAQLFELFSKAGFSAAVKSAPAASGAPAAAGKVTPFPTVDSIDTKTKQLESIYERVCFIVGKERVSFDDIKALFNPSKTHQLEEIAGTSLKGSDHICINFRSDHPYFYNTALAIEISQVLRARFVAHSTAKLVEGNFADADGVSSPASPISAAAAAAAAAATGEHSSTATAAPTAASGGGSSARGAGFNRIADLFQAGVIQLPSFSDVDHLQAAAMELTRALDWVPGATPAAALATLSLHVKRLCEEVEEWEPSPDEVAAHAALAAAASRRKDSVMSTGSAKSNNNHHANNGVVSATATAAAVIAAMGPQRCVEFRKRASDIRQYLVEKFLLPPPEACDADQQAKNGSTSLSERLAFWRTKRTIPQFDDQDDAELAAELALQNLLFRSDRLFRSLWADITLAFGAEKARFEEHCRLLCAPVVPFSYFGIPPEFETVRFDLVRFHLQSLAACKSPSSMLNAVVSAIKCVIVCVKARHILSRRWSRAMSGIASLPTSPIRGGGGGGGNLPTMPSSGIEEQRAASGGSTDTSPESSPLNPITSAAFWTKDELDAIAHESRKHSLYNTDDILPVFIYILVFCGMPTLVYYYRFLETLSFDGEQTERTFYFTVFCSAMQWVIDWKKPSRRELFPGGKQRASTLESTRSVDSSSSASAALQGQGKRAHGMLSGTEDLGIVIEGEGDGAASASEDKLFGSKKPSDAIFIRGEDGDDDDGGSFELADSADGTAPPRPLAAASVSAASMSDDGASSPTVAAPIVMPALTLDSQRVSFSPDGGSHQTHEAEGNDSDDDVMSDDEWLSYKGTCTTIGPFSSSATWRQ